MTLTPRQAEISAHILRGLSNKEIAEKLQVRTKTVLWHITILYKKEKVRTRFEYLVKKLGLRE